MFNKTFLIRFSYSNLLVKEIKSIKAFLNSIYDKIMKNYEYLTCINFIILITESSSGFQNLIQDSSQKIFIVEFKKKIALSQNLLIL